MAESVLSEKSITIKELPILNALYNCVDVRCMIYQRERYEHRVKRRNKKKLNFTIYINYLKSVIKRVKTMNQDSDTVELINLYNSRIALLYDHALKHFSSDITLWVEYIKFLMKNKQPTVLQKVLNRALLLHGYTSDSLYIFAVEVEIEFLKNIQKAREIYTSGLKAHKNSSSLYFEAFKCELTSSKFLIQELSLSGNELNSNDPALNGFEAKVVFELAVENMKSDTYLFFEMHRVASQYDFSFNLTKDIKKFISTTFNMDPNYWDTMATNELLDTSNSNKILKIINCVQKFKVALSIVDTDEMWDKYLTTIIKIISDSSVIELVIINLIKTFIHGAHKKNKLKPNHYIELINNSKSSMAEELVDWATEAYPDDISIKELNIKVKLTDKDELIAYQLFKENADQVSLSIWLIIVEYFSNKPQISCIFNMVFGFKSLCTNEVKIKLGNVYLSWLSKNKSLDDARNEYLLLIANNSCDASLCKTLVTLETEQQIIDINKVRQHFTLACLQFGKTDIDLWMKRIQFEQKYGSQEHAFIAYYQALTTLSNEESNKLTEQYIL